MSKIIYRTICLCMSTILILGSVGCSKKNTELETTSKPPVELSTEEQKKLLTALSGVYTGKMTMTDNPLKLEGQMFIPKDNIYKIAQYYIEKQNNGDITNLVITLQDGNIKVKLNYKALGFINAPVQLSIVPSINNGDIILKIKDIKASGIKVDDQTALGILKSAIASEKDISVSDNSIIISKSKFAPIEIDNITVDNENIVIDIKMPIEKFLNK